MGTISVSLPSDGTTADVGDYNTPINTIVNAINGGLDNSNIASGAAIDAAKLSGGASGMFGALQTYTPTWTNVTVGNGTVNFKWGQIGKWTSVRGSFIVGSTTAVTGTIIFSLPTPSVIYPGTAGTQALGVGNIFDVSAPMDYKIEPVWNSTTTARLNAFAANGTWVTFSNANNNDPVGPNTGDEWFFELIYEAA